jgi:uncharacterized membrane protein YfcA
MIRSGKRALLHQSKLIRKHELKIRHDWKILVIIFIIAVLGCFIGTYVGLNYPD